METMASLVADYGVSSGSENEDETKTKFSKERIKTDEEGRNRQTTFIDHIKTSNELNKLPLPTPDFNGTPTLKTSVFLNPFVEAERAKRAILEKHVKMTPTLDDTKVINGRKICWNYRKGRCRFGHNCTFAHDSDLHRTGAELEMIQTPEEIVICQTNSLNQKHDDEEVDQENNQSFKRNKRRPGLTQNLVPSKKILKIYKTQQTKASGR